MLDIAKTTKFVDRCWSDEIVSTLVEYIKIPNKSPAFDPDWAARGCQAARAHPRDPHRNTRRRCRYGLLYGHLDEQPEMVGWTPGYGPWIARLEGDKLYGRGGRGGADDGYAMFGALSALMALKAQGVPYARCIILDRGLRGIRQL